MSAALPVTAADCCAICDAPPISNIPGPAGSNGSNGTNGTNGVNAVTLTTASFIMPAVAGTVNVAVANSTWAAVGQVIYVQNTGYFSVTNVPDATHLTLRNLGYAGNVLPTTVVAMGSKVSPAGIKGTDGAGGVPPTLNDLSPTTTRGDLIVDNGANNPNASDVRLGAGSDGKILTTLSSQPTGLEWQTLLPNGVSDNRVPRFDASGTTVPTPLQSSLLKITDTGALQHTDGNARGTDAVDLQPVRAANTQVASGANATIAGGQNNTASGDNSVVGGGSTNVASGTGATVCGGASNTASGQNSTVAAGSSNVASGLDSSVLAGTGNTASGVYSSILGGFNNVASGQGSSVSGEINTASATDSACLGGALNIASADSSATLGGFQAQAYLFGQVSHASGNFSSVGDAQVSELIWKGTTTDATANVELFIGPVSQRATVPNNKTWVFSMLFVGRKSDGTSAAWKVEGAIKNDGGTTVLVGAVTTTVLADGTGSTWGLAGNILVDADNANDALRVRVTGAAASNIRWVGSARLVECGY